MGNAVQPYATTSTAEPVRIFSAGQVLPSGKIADEAFLDAVVANWAAAQAKGDPRFPKPRALLIPAASVSIGHEPNSSIAQQYAQRSDLPAVGWPTKVWRDGKYLLAMLTGIPLGLARWIATGVYGDRSAEFYEDYQGHGPCLRRISILGADIPACKDLGPMPNLVIDTDVEGQANPLAFSESLASMASKKHPNWAVSIGGVGFVTFSEQASKCNETKGKGQGNMTPIQQAVFDALKAAGVDTTNLDGMAIDQIIAAASPASQNSEGGGDDKDGDEKKDIAMNAAKYSEMAAMLGVLVKPLHDKLASMESQLATANAKLASTDQQREREAIAAFCEANKERLFPYELDATKGPTIIDQLLAMPTAKVATFAEGKLSPREHAMAAIKARPVNLAKFAEKLADPMGVKAGQADKVPPERREELLSKTNAGRAILAAQKK